MFRAQSAYHQEVNDANCIYAASGIVTLCKWPSCATAKAGMLKACKQQEKTSYGIYVTEIKEGSRKRGERDCRFWLFDIWLCKIKEKKAELYHGNPTPQTLPADYTTQYQLQ
jgi:hypothetical protein